MRSGMLLLPLMLFFCTNSHAISLDRYDGLPEEYKYVYVRALIDSRLAMPVYGKDFSRCLMDMAVEGLQHEYKKFMYQQRPENDFKAIMDFPSLFNMLSLEYCGEFADQEERGRVVDILDVPVTQLP